MQSDEIVVARLSKGASIVRYLSETASRVTVTLGRNRQARIPHDRVLLATGLTVSADAEVEEFRARCEGLSSEIDLRDVWDVVWEEGAAASIESLAELYWASGWDPARLVALALHLENDSDYFVYGEGGYTPRSLDAVEELRARRRREAENAAAAESLMGELSEGRLPEPVTPSQEALLQHLRGYAVHGEEYARSAAALRLVGMLPHTTGDLPRRSFDLLVAAGVFSPDEHLELHRAGIPFSYPQDAIDEVATIHLDEALADPRRRDLTALPVITIDDAGTQDKDDALSLELEYQEGGAVAPVYRIGIHIADAGALIPGGGALDREADRRMATLYLPDRKIEMLPPGFSRRLGSLDAGETRAAISVLVRVAASGEVLGWEVVPSVIRSRASLSYEEAEAPALSLAEVTGTSTGLSTGPWSRALGYMEEVTSALRLRREAAGAVSVDRPEMHIKVHSSGEVEVRVMWRSPARIMVAEMMILCNSLLADFARAEGLPAVYRSQEAPDLSDLDSGSGPLASTPSTAEEALRRFLIMRRLAPAELSTAPAPHSGLGVPAYIQATSPLRRYLDLVMQRQISHFLGHAEPLYSTETIASVGHRADVQLRELAYLEEGRKRYWFLKYLQQTRLEGASSEKGSRDFQAVVLENNPGRRGLLELLEYPFRPRAELPLASAPGDTVTLRLQGVDLWHRVGQFVAVAPSS